MKPTTSLAAFSAAVLLSVSCAAADPLPFPAELASRQYNPITYLGCYSSSSGLTFSKSLQYNTKGSCQTQCGKDGGYSVEATTNELDCWCGNSEPDKSNLVSDSNCNQPCGGYQQEMCGSANSKYFSVYLSGYGTVSDDGDSASASSSSSQSAPSSTSSSMSTSTVRAASTAAAVPSVVTLSGNTVTVSTSNTASASPSGSAQSSGGGTNKAGIAAGVVVGVVAITAIIGGLYFYIRNRRRREVEDEYKRNAAVSNFIAGGKPPTSSSGQSFNDTRLDPVMAQRRMSDGSIADNQDYSRRILKVTNA